ncbi:MAG TPA: hypothetical protein VLE74_01440 [Candidatus Saccharimonadales bacterium]|nr:hypothetical protein [Candidatus Saccharimonadales bacterium]
MSQQQIRNIIEMSREDGPITIGSVDLTVCNPAVVTEVFGHGLAFSGAVESEVATTAAVVRTITPHRSEQDEEFINVWEEQEIMHGRIIEEYAQQLGLQLFPQRTSLPVSMKLAGLLARVSPGFHDVAQYYYRLMGVTGEKETLGFYKNSVRTLEAIGEHPLAASLNRIAKQEGRHLAYYVLSSKEQRTQLRPWQHHAARTLLEHAFLPVGIRFDRMYQERQRHVGRWLLHLSGGDLRALANPVQALAEQVLGATAGEMSPFVLRRYQKSVNAYLAAEAA